MIGFVFGEMKNTQDLSVSDAEDVPRFPFPVPRSPFPVPRSPFPVPRSPFPIPRSPFPVPSSPFPVPRSSLFVFRSPFSFPFTSFQVTCFSNLMRSETQTHLYNFAFCLKAHFLFTPVIYYLNAPRQKHTGTFSLRIMEGKHFALSEYFFAIQIIKTLFCKVVQLELLVVGRVRKSFHTILQAHLKKSLPLRKLVKNNF